MKKTLSLLLVLVMLLSLCACGREDTQNINPGTVPGQATADNTEEPTDGTADGTQVSTEELTATPTEESTNSTTDGTQAPVEKPVTVPTDDTQVSLEKPVTAPTEGAQVSTEKPTTAPTDDEQGSTENPTTAPTETPAPNPTACEHTYTVATCSIPKICTKCQEIGGHTLPHNYENGTCTVCGRAEILVTFQEGDWVAYVVKAGTGEQGEILSEYVISKNRNYTNVVCYSNASACVMNLGKVTYNEKTYYADYYPTTFTSRLTWEENGDTVTVKVELNTSVEFVLTKMSETQLSVTSSNDKANIPVGMVFNKA